MIVRNIRRLCAEKGITLAELERLVGLGNGVIARWAKCSPRVESIKPVADFFGVSVDDLIREEE